MPNYSKPHAGTFASTSIRHEPFSSALFFPYPSQHSHTVREYVCAAIRASQHLICADAFPSAIRATLKLLNQTPFFSPWIFSVAAFVVVDALLLTVPLWSSALHVYVFVHVANNKKHATRKCTLFESENGLQGCLERGGKKIAKSIMPISTSFFTFILLISWLWLMAFHIKCEKSRFIPHALGSGRMA